MCIRDSYKRELKAAREARKLYPEMFSIIRREVRALAALGRVNDVRKVIEESLTLPGKSGDPGSVMKEAARELRAKGNLKESLEMANQALDWYKSRASAGKNLHSELADALYLAERWGEAKEVYVQLRAEEPDNIDYLGNLGTLAARRRDKDEALRISEELKNINRPYLFGNQTYWRACIASLLGEKEQAVSLLRDSFAQGGDYGVYLLQDMDLEPLREYPPFKELMRPKK